MTIEPITPEERRELDIAWYQSELRARDKQIADLQIKLNQMEDRLGEALAERDYWIDQAEKGGGSDE